MNVPDDIAASLAASVGAYIRATPAQDLPGRLRRFKGWRPKALAGHRSELLAFLEEEAARKRILKWLSDDKVPLKAPDAELLRLACERADDWESQLASRSKMPSAPTKRTSPGPDLTAALEQERRKVREAKEDARTARAQARAVADAQRRRTEELSQEIAVLEDRVRDAEATAASLSSEGARARAAAERDRRKLLRDVQRLKTERDDLKRELKDARRANTALERKAAELERRLEPRGPGSGAASKASRAPSAAPPAERRALPVPQGLFDDSPETLSAWLDAPMVTLLVDGYNVAKSEEGFGRLDLPAQRTRLIDEVDRLARRRGVPATIVFDGATVDPGLSRRRRQGVSVVYSRPPETADDHLVALLQGLPNHPVILVTSDRELRERAAQQGASLAYSTQLLALIR
jgi:predicted RNA-binding protein with PIN domain